ncbi:MAG: hypothetical protein PUB96_08230 [Helicobacteraceae bacterium]|nr:hypothetical protein [Helicobacteraceae bacterium]
MSLKNKGRILLKVFLILAKFKSLFVGFLKVVFNLFQKCYLGFQLVGILIFKLN